MGSTLLAAAFATACLLAGGFYESTYSLLGAAIWLGLAIAGSFAPLRRPSPAVWALVALALWTALSALWRYVKQMAPAKKAYFRKTRSVKARKTFVKKQAAQLKALQRAVKACN